MRKFNIKLCYIEYNKGTWSHTASPVCVFAILTICVCFSLNSHLVPVTYLTLPFTGNIPDFFFLIIPWPSLPECSVIMVLFHWHSGFTLGFEIVPHGAKTCYPTKSHLGYSCFQWSLKGLFTRMCDYEVHRVSVFCLHELHLASGVKCFKHNHFWFW
jgi:hypothetical protein